MSVDTYQMSKFITQFLRHKEVGPEEDAGVPCDRIVEKCKEVLSEDSRYWSDEVKQKLNMAPHWSAETWIDVLSEGGGQKKRFQYCLKPHCPEKTCTFEPFKVIQEKRILEMLVSILRCKTMYCYQGIITRDAYHIGNGREWRSTVRNGLVPGRIQHWDRQTCRTPYRCEPDGR